MSLWNIWLSSVPFLRVCTKRLILTSIFLGRTLLKSFCVTGPSNENTNSSSVNPYDWKKQRNTQISIFLAPSVFLPALSSTYLFICFICPALGSLVSRNIAFVTNYRVTVLVVDVNHRAGRSANK